MESTSNPIPENNPIPLTQEKHPSWVKRIGIISLILLLPITGAVLYILKIPGTGEKIISITGADLGDESPDAKQRVRTFIEEISPPPSVTPTPSVIPIAKGPQTYNVNSNSESGLKIQQVTISEFDPGVGTEQSFTVKVADTLDKTINEITVLLKTDKRERTVRLQRKEKSGINELWVGSWKVDDTHDNVYELTVKATGSAGSNSVELMFR